MKRIFLIPFLILMLVGFTNCAPKTKTKESKVTFSKMFLAGPGAFAGGAMVWADGGPGKKFAINLVGDNTEKILPAGEYKFFSVGWLGGSGETSGVMKCGKALKTIAEETENVGISLTQANCATDDFVPPAYTGVHPNGMRLYTCGDVTSVVGAGGCVGASPQSTGVSFKIAYPQYNGDPGNFAPGMLVSPCSGNAAGDMNNTSNLVVMGKAGIPLMSMRVLVFDSANCAGTPKAYNLDAGLINVQAPQAKVFVGGSHIELHLAHGWDTNVVTNYDITYGSNQTAGTSFPITVVAKNGLNQVVTNQDATLNARTFAGWPGFSAAPDASNSTVPLTLTFVSGSATSNITARAAETIAASTTLVSDNTGIPVISINPVTVDPGVKAQLVYATQPVATVAGNTIPTFTVQVTDAFQNVLTTNTDNVTLSLQSGTGTLFGTLTKAAVTGVATFNDISINISGAKVLQATSNGGFPVNSNPFNITHAAAANLLFSTEPITSIAGVGLLPVVELKDAYNNTVTTGADSTGTVSFAIGTNPAGGTLFGTTSKAMVSGVATWLAGDAMYIDNASPGYDLDASYSIHTQTSAAFTIQPGAATQLVYNIQPSNHTALATAPTVVVEARDPLGNLDITYTSPITLSLSTNPGGGTISGTNPSTSTAGVATFTDLIFNGAGAGHVLNATDGGLNQTSNAFTLTAPPAPGNPLNLKKEVLPIVGDLVLDWDPPSPLGNTVGYRISYNVGGAAPTDCSTGTTNIGEGSITGTKHVITNLAQGTQYAFRLCSIDGMATPQESTGVTVGVTASYVHPIQQVRSVGGNGSTAPVATGASNAVTIDASGLATFTTGLDGLKVGIGDVIDYDTNGAPANATNAMAVVVGRLSSTQFYLKQADGTSLPLQTTGDTDWLICRAYNSLSNAESLVNNGCMAAIDTAGERHLVTNNEIWNFALYNDAQDTQATTIDGWTTGPHNYLNIFTPVDIGHVGASQRHSGSSYAGEGPPSGFKVYKPAGGPGPLVISDPHVRITGLIFEWAAGGGTNPLISILSDDSHANADIRLSHNIIYFSAGANTHDAIHIDASLLASTKVSIFNNLIYNPITHGVNVQGGQAYVYNNTCDTGSGTSCYNSAMNTAVFMNNISKNGIPDFGGVWSASSNYNSSADGTAPGANSQTGTPSFVNTPQGNYRLTAGDTLAKDNGVDLTNDPNLPIIDDLIGQTRGGTWDIGAYISNTDVTPPTDNAASFQFTNQSDADGMDVDVSWTAFTDNVAVTDHRIKTYTNSACTLGEVDHGLTGSSAANNITIIDGLATGSYWAKVTAYDAAANATESACSTDSITVP